MFDICNVCLSYDIKMHCIENSELFEIYEKLIMCTELKTTFEVNTTICYICYSQLQRSLKFSKLALQSQKRLKKLVDSGVEVSKDTILMLNLGTKHNLSVTNVPPLSININSDTKHIQAIMVKEELIKVEESVLAEDDKITNYLSKCHSPVLTHLVVNSNSSVRKQLKQSSNVPCISLKRKIKKVQMQSSKPQTTKGHQHTIQDSKAIDLSKLNVDQEEKVFKDSAATQIFKDSSHTNNIFQIAEEEQMALTDLKASQEIVNTNMLFNTPVNNSNCKEEENVDISTLNVDEKEPKIKKTIQKLMDLIEKVKPSMISMYNFECQKIREDKNAKRLPKRRFPWCNQSRSLLTLLVKLAGSEKAGAKLLKNRILRLFPKGFARMPTLLKMAGYKLTNVKKMENMQLDSASATSPKHNDQEVPPHSIVLKTTSLVPCQIEIPSSSKSYAGPGENKELPLPYITNTFSLNIEPTIEYKEQ